MPPFTVRTASTWPRPIGTLGSGKIDVKLPLIDAASTRFQLLPPAGVTPLKSTCSVPPSPAVPAVLSAECVTPVISGMKTLVDWNAMPAVALKFTFAPITRVVRASVACPVLTVAVPAVVPPSVSVLPAAPTPSVNATRTERATGADEQIARAALPDTHAAVRRHQAKRIVDDRQRAAAQDVERAGLIRVGANRDAGRLRLMFELT